MTATIEVAELQVRLSEIKKLTLAGIEVILTENGVAIARLLPFPAPSTPRIAGLHPGAIGMSDDFDEPLPDDFWTGTE